MIWSQSAGNINDILSKIFIKYINIYKYRTSEILCNEIVNFIKNIFNIDNIDNTRKAEIPDFVVHTENIKLISKHVPTHLKPINDKQFGHYLAGLIDGNGYFNTRKTGISNEVGNTKQQLVISFNSLDIQLAYFIKKQLGYGYINKIKNKQTYILVVDNKKGIIKIINLINNKIRTINIYNQIINIINTYEAGTPNLIEHKQYLFNKFNRNTSNDFNNHWLAGFTDAKGSFDIKIINNYHKAGIPDLVDNNLNNKVPAEDKWFNTSCNKVEICLNYLINQNNIYMPSSKVYPASKDILLLIKNYIGGNISYIKDKDIYYYNSTSFGSAKNIINYFDKYHLLSSKHINYLKWRKVYLIIQDKNHLNKIGFNKILKLKQSISYLNK